LFGTLRFVLALMVMLSHLWTELSLWAGPYAVFGFFLLSGYLMARVLNRSYASAGGTRRFFANRALRIYPPYLAILALSVLLVSIVPETARGLNPHLVPPTDVLEWLRNLFVFTLHIDNANLPSLIPPAWSVDVELCLYLAIGLVIRRSVAATALAVIVCAVYTGVLLAQGVAFPERYSSVLAGGLPFGIGALIYHGRELVSSALGGHLRTPLFLAVSLFAANAIAPAIIPRGWAFYGGFYVSMVAIALLVMALSQLDPRRVATSWARTDEFLGSLSYPLFLCHWQVAVVAIWLGLAAGKGAALFLWCLPLATATAWAVHRLVEQPIEALRNQVRGVAG
jgi:peptidoglycan/LPS O-acetylase OafA/YrhL